MGIWIALAVGLCCVLPCGSGLAWVMYIGAVGPDTSVYTGNQVPKRYVETMKTVGALEPGENILYFYSDAMTDIRDGFYFVSDRKVAVYTSESGDEPLTAIKFDVIDDVDISRSDTFPEDSEVTLTLKGGDEVSFPLSQENDKDQKFVDAIKARMASQQGQ